MIIGVGVGVIGVGVGMQGPMDSQQGLLHTTHLNLDPGVDTTTMTTNSATTTITTATNTIIPGSECAVGSDGALPCTEPPLHVQRQRQDSLDMVMDLVDNQT